MATTLTRQDISLILSLCSHLIQEQRVPLAEHGVAVAGSWAPQDNAAQRIEASTVEATIGKTYAIVGDDGDTAFAKPRLPVLTMQIGDQHGPIGNERIVLIHTDEGPVAAFIHGADDTPGTPAGERWIVHYDPVQAAQNPPVFVPMAYIKHTNDADTTGDNKAGTCGLFGGYALHKTTTGLAQEFSDKFQTVIHSVTNALGTFQQKMDGIRGAISHIAPFGGLVAIGDEAKNLSTTANAAFAQLHVTNYDGNLQVANLKNFITNAELYNTAGVMTSGQLITVLAPMVAGWTHSTTIPAGSLKALISS